MDVSQADLQQAFDGFVARLTAKTALRGEALDGYLRQVREAFEDYRRRDSATVEANARFILLRSTCIYVGNPGDNQVNLELPPDAEDAVLGEAVVDVLSASRRMMREYLAGAHPQIERTEGMQRYQALNDGLCRRHGYRSKSALFKWMRLVHVTSDRATSAIRMSPTNRVAVDGFEGLGTAHEFLVPGGSAASDIGAALRAAMSRCTDGFRR